MLVLRSNFYSKNDDTEREHSAPRSVKSGLKAAGTVAGVGAGLGALGGGYLGNVIGKLGGHRTAGTLVTKRKKKNDSIKK